MVGLLVAGGAQMASAHRTPLSVEIVSEQASLAPDGGSMTFLPLHRVRPGWTIVEFQTGPAEATAVLVVQQGRTKRAQDSATLRVRPDVSVVLADQAVLEGDGACGSTSG